MTHHQIISAKGLEGAAKVRAFCKQLPEVVEKVDGFGHITFRVKGKPFVMMGETDGQPSTAIKTNLTTQEFLLQQEDSPYHKTAYIGQHGWVSILDMDRVPWTEITDLITEGYARTAPKKLRQLLQTE
ncbi:MmcQ/YjbR family DNA-binding protein [Paenibacillus aceris]|uniref:DNA-binding protein (MmcQ/YjbR family) n=1 Tax=Paenibacillus aceris TaxID=869555 RepID=A0ABS4HZ43_9BACL|nr:MmcQ/YjbR family DNA-binding protein [Paenibacillus aceris]MBP1963952.1 putative DNA-binding protein (MmcQ/YjbR family) [Paenibacillus aceris]NHW34629.1 MmcQ/YjbR family DNA-binding protein [Paenibacillus aceris]